MLWLVLAVARLCRSLAFMVKGSKKPVSTLAALSGLSSAMLLNGAAQRCPPALLSPERQCCLSHMHSQKGNYLSHGRPGDPQITLLAHGPLPSFITRALLCP